MSATFYRKTTVVSPTLDSLGAIHPRSTSTHDMRIDSNNYPVVAYLAFDSIVYVKKYNGTEWIDLGFPTEDSIVFGSALAIEIDSNDNIYVAAIQYVATTYILKVKKYSAGTWSIIGNASPFPAARIVSSVALDLDSNNNPIVCGSDGHLSVARFNGTSWDDLAIVHIDHSPNSGVKAVSLKVSTNNTIWLALKSSTAYLDILKYAEGSWTYVGQNLAPIYNVIMVLDSNDVPVLSTLYTTIYTIRKYNGSTWDIISTQDSGANTYGYQSLSLDLNDNVTLVYHSNVDDRLYARRYINYAWVDFEGGTIQELFSAGISSCFDTTGNFLILYEHRDTNGVYSTVVSKYVPASDSSEWIRV